MIKIYHNPRCSKSRQTLTLLENNGIEPEVILYLQTPPSEKELRQLLKQLGISPRALLRKNEEPYKTLNLDDKNLDDAALINAMLEHPKLIERPIVTNGKQAVLGRPPENIKALL
ncbi:MAG: arsenate reductase (glutaredoxin) [Cellvibrionaceae bacterium]|nr:arsenate reductase (glutaredoxin) [Cellvibrionaceae bacterium]